MSFDMYNLISIIMEKREIIKQAIKSLEVQGVSYRELMAYLLKGNARNISYEIVYADNSVSLEYVYGKEIKGVIFTIEAKEVFISARYAPKKMTKSESAKYCASIKVKGYLCTEGEARHWIKRGLLYRYQDQINQVLEELGLEKIDNRLIWSSCFSGHYNGELYYSIYPISCGAQGSNVCNCLSVRPVCFLD